jgi:outer membrane protein
LKFNVTSDYVQLLRSQQQLRLREEQVGLAQQQLDLIDARIQVGDAARSDRAPLLRELALAKQRRIEAQNDVNVSASALRNSMGLPVGPGPQITELPEPSFEVPAFEPSLEEAMRTRPDLVQDEAAVDVSRAGVSLARVRRRPLVQATVSANATPRNDFSRGDYGFFTGVTMPLWDAGLTRAREREAEAGLDQSQARLEQTRKDIGADVQQALLNVSSAKERVDASRASVEAATVALEVANARFQQGLARPIDLTDAQLGFFTARNDQINALYDYHLAQAQIDLAIGRE